NLRKTMTTPALSIRPIAAAPATRSEIGFFGGKPIFDVPLEIVRPRFLALDTFGARFQDALRSGNVTNNGRWVLEFERQLTEYLGVPTATFCNGQNGDDGDASRCRYRRRRGDRPRLHLLGNPACCSLVQCRSGICRCPAGLHVP